jgi:hypothetical protein
MWASYAEYDPKEFEHERPALCIAYPFHLPLELGLAGARQTKP